MGANNLKAELLQAGGNAWWMGMAGSAVGDRLAGWSNFATSRFNLYGSFVAKHVVGYSQPEPDNVRRVLRTQLPTKNEMLNAILFAT